MSFCMHSGRPVLSEDENAIRREYCNDEMATAAWRAAGESWEVVSSWIVTARLKLARAGQRIPGGSVLTSLFQCMPPQPKLPLR